jgi:thiol-disulfide isomerase/thioredoxin
MLNRIHLLGALALIAALGLGAPAVAMEKKPFDAKAFESAQAAGKPILLEVHAPWCPTCRAQQPILSRLSKSEKFKDIVRFNIDFDSQKELLRKFNVRMQSTLIVFKGKREAGRSAGDTNAASIEALLAKAI